MNRARPPWKLDGFCMIIFYLTSSRRMEDFIPAPLEVAEVFPGTTLSGLYAASYAQSGTGALNEFCAFPALTRYKKRKGFYVPCSLVESQEGYYECKGVWGLKKEKAIFEWRQEGSRYILDVQSGGEEILNVQISVRKVSIPVRVTFPFFHVRGNGVVSHHADYAAKVHLSSSSVTIPDRSPLAAYALNRKLLTTLWQTTRITLHPPESEKVVIPKEVSEGIFHVPHHKPPEPSGVKKTSEECCPCKVL
jgi:hypothetical protein